MSVKVEINLYYNLLLGFLDFAGLKVKIEEAAFLLHSARTIEELSIHSTIDGTSFTIRETFYRIQKYIDFDYNFRKFTRSKNLMQG